jgi:hypothetical protein
MTTHLSSSRSFVPRLTAVGLMLALLAVTACTRPPEISTSAAGHAITADIKGHGAKVEALPERGVLSSEFGQVTIERARMRVGELAWVQIAEDVPVNVTIHRGKIALKAGRVSVAQTVSHP